MVHDLVYKFVAEVAANANKVPVRRPIVIAFLDQVRCIHNA
jgi:hypothetical protein